MTKSTLYITFSSDSNGISYLQHFGIDYPRLWSFSMSDIVKQSTHTQKKLVKNMQQNDELLPFEKSQKDRRKVMHGYKCFFFMRFEGVLC